MTRKLFSFLRKFLRSENKSAKFGKTKVNESSILPRKFLRSPIRDVMKLSWAKENIFSREITPCKLFYIEHQHKLTMSSVVGRADKKRFAFFCVSFMREISEVYVGVFLCLPYFFFRRLFSLSRNSQQNWTLSNRARLSIK